MGLIHIYCGDGKGKTTAATGLSLRALGSGYTVIFAQFLKGSKSGEVELLKTLSGIRVLRADKPQKFSHQLNSAERAEVYNGNNRLFSEAVSLAKGERVLLVLDEIIGAINTSLIDSEPVIEFLKSKPEAEVVLTGRNPSRELLRLADYISEIKKVRHPFDSGISAREGIEF